MLGSGKRPDDRPGRKLCARAPSSLRRGCHLHVSRDRYFASWVIKRQFVRFLSPASSPRPKRATVLSLRIASRCDDRTSAVICVPWPSWSGYPSRRAPHASWSQRQHSSPPSAPGPRRGVRAIACCAALSGGALVQQSDAWGRAAISQERLQSTSWHLPVAFAWLPSPSPSGQLLSSLQQLRQHFGASMCNPSPAAPRAIFSPLRPCRAVNLPSKHG